MTLFRQSIRFGPVIAAALLLVGCTSQARIVSEAPALASVTPTTLACIDAIGADDKPVGPQLDPSLIRVFNWNMQKAIHSDWADDLDAIYGEADILTMQEALPDLSAWHRLTLTPYRSFAQGYSGFGRSTGVMTLSVAAPIAKCDLVEYEPWLGTPKAMLVTEYGIADFDKTLLVINLHGVNFSFGTRELQQQLASAERIIAAHQGPVILSGDFNTWRGARMSLINELVGKLGLRTPEYDDDHRKRFLGWPLDHIYVRGLETLHATTFTVDSSDHNPMLVELRLRRDEEGGVSRQ